MGDYLRLLTVSDREIGHALATLAPGQRSVVEAISVDGRSISETSTSRGRARAR